MDEKKIDVPQKLSKEITDRRRLPKTPSHREALSKSLSGKPRPYASGKKHWNWKGGKPNCIDCGNKSKMNGAKRCRSCYIKFSTKANNPNWKGGIAKGYPKEFNRTLKFKIRTRDNFTCCLCGKTEQEELNEINRVLCVNHIDFDRNNCAESNLNTLCVRCNVKIIRNKDYWIDYFKLQQIN